MPTFTGIVSLPPIKNVPTFNSPNYNQAGQALTYGDALKEFLAFPQAQGKEQLLDTDISGTLNLYGDMNIVGTGNYIQFPDNTQQSTAFIEANYAQLNTDNTFLSPYIQTFQGTNASSGLNAPIVVSNSQTTNKASLFIDDANNLDFTLYSNQTDGGMTIRNAGGNSFTVAPLAPNNTATFSNPISCGSQSLTCGAINTSGSLTLTNGANTSVLTTGASGLNVADPIVSTGQISGNNFLVNASGQDQYSIYSNSIGGYGLVLANTTTGGVGTLTLSNNSTTLTTMSSTTSGLNIADPVICNSLTTSGTGSITTSGVLQLNTNSYSVQLGCGDLGNQLVVNNNTRIVGSLNASVDVVATGIIEGNSLTTIADATIGGNATITGTTIANNMRIATNANIAGQTISTAGLTIGRNLEVGQNEFDIIAINPTTANYLNIYGSQSSVSISSTPIISIANGTAYLNGNQIATITGNTSSYTVGQIITGIFSTPPTGFLLCNGQYIPTSSYPSLYALIGTAYNAYNAGVPGGYYSMPNLVSAVPLGANSVINEYGTNIPSYNDTVILNGAQGGNNLQTSFLSHNHPVTTSHSHTYGTGFINVSNGSGGGTCAAQTGGSGGPTYYTTSVAQPTNATGNAGASNVSNISQFLAVNYYIYGGTP